VNKKEENWDIARNTTGDVKLVLSLIKRGMHSLTRGRKNMGYPFSPYGEQRRKSERGESKIEAKLLSSSNIPKTCILNADGIRKKVQFKANAAGLGNRRKGNIIADLFGIDGLGSPVAGEIKITHKNPWYAVVECVEQVALLRVDRKHLSGWLHKELGENIRGRGAWGVVIAPKDYWKKKERQAAERLVKELNDKTKIRICCACYDQGTDFNLNNIFLNVLFGKPPLTRR
jgi:hypothetical protein